MVAGGAARELGLEALSETRFGAGEQALDVGAMAHDDYGAPQTDRLGERQQHAKAGRGRFSAALATHPQA